jgi:dsRNA-specific ribonuclease
MDNPNNKLITKIQIENILNYFVNIGNNQERLQINNLEIFQQSFVNESYYQAVQNSILNNLVTESNTYINYVPVESNERLEYLGDHILKSIIGRYLFERFPNEREGFLTRLKIKIEKCSMLHKFAVELGFREHILLSLQVENQTILDYDRGRCCPAYYEDCFEAFIGAMMIEFGEMGYIYADRFVRSVIENTIDFAEIISKNDNFKDSIQRFFQMHRFAVPVYFGLSEEGPLYRKVFTRILMITCEQFDTFSPDLQSKIDKYTNNILKFYKNNNPEVYLKLIQELRADKRIIGLGFGKKVVQAEQECAKVCLQNFNLDLDY